MSGQIAYPTFAGIEERIDTIAMDGMREPARAAAELLAIGERVLESWVRARGEVPTDARREGFRLLALHRQGARGEPSFNACRETCRELVYHYNLIALEPDHPDTGHRLTLAAMIARHLMLFVGGKLEVAGLGAFCCSSRPLRAAGH
jgi:hypothetical protein